MTLDLDQYDVLVFDIGKAQIHGNPFVFYSTHSHQHVWLIINSLYTMCCHFKRFCLGINVYGVSRNNTPSVEGTVCPISFVKDVLVSRLSSTGLFDP